MFESKCDGEKELTSSKLYDILILMPKEIIQIIYDYQLIIDSHKFVINNYPNDPKLKGNQVIKMIRLFDYVVCFLHCDPHENFLNIIKLMISLIYIT